MIPKVIHYCWFGGSEKPDTVKRCMESWKKYCPDYKIVEWNEENFDIDSCAYASEAYRAGKWAFVSDYARLKVVLDNGGVYLDTDVELVKSLDGLRKCEAFAGFENAEHVATGLGFGAVVGHPMVREMEEDYHARHFVDSDGSMDLTPCPVINTKVLIRNGLTPNGEEQVVCGMTVLPSDYLCPIDFRTGEKRVTENTVSIHHFDGTWYTPFQKAKKTLKSIIPTFVLKRVRGGE